MPLPKGTKIDGPTPGGGAYWVDTGEELVEVDTQGNEMGRRPVEATAAPVVKPSRMPKKPSRMPKKPSDG